MTIRTQSAVLTVTIVLLVAPVSLPVESQPPMLSTPEQIGGLERKLGSGPVTSVSSSEDGKWIASGSRDTTVRVWDAARGTELQRLEGHTDHVNSVSFSRDGKRIVSGSADNALRVWDVVTGKEVQRLEGHAGAVMSVSFSADGKWIASASADNTVRVWDATTGKELKRLQGHTDEVYSVSFSRDGEWIASGSADSTVRVWDAATGEELRRLEGQTHDVYSVSFSRDGKWIASGSADNTVRVWDAATGKELKRLQGHTDEVYSVSFSRDGEWIASGSADKTVRVWDVATGQELQRLTGHAFWVNSVRFSACANWITSGSFDSTVRVWDAATGKELQRLERNSGNVSSVSLSGDGKWIASGSGDNTVRVWDRVAGKELQRFEGHGGRVNSVSFSQDGKWIASGADDNTVRLWSAATGQELQRLEGHADDVYSVSFSRDGKWVASGSGDNTVRVWDAAAGKELQRLEGHTGVVRAVSFSGDGKRIASASGDRTVRVWDWVTASELQRLEGHRLLVMSVSFSRDGKWIASGSTDRTVRVWDAATGKELQRLEGHGHRVNSVSFGRDGKWIASGADDNTVRLWSAATGQEVQRLEGHADDVYSVSFSRDGKWVASGSLDNTVRVWDATMGNELQRFEGHADEVHSLSFNDDRNWIACGTPDNTVRVLDATTGREVLRLEGHTDDATSVSFSRDGKWIATGADDSTVRVWDASTGKEVQRLEGHTGVVIAVSFSGDGKWIASGAHDGTVRVWDVTTGAVLQLLRGHTGQIWSVSFSGGGKRIATGADDKTVRVWDAATGEELKRLEGHTGSVFSVSFSADGKWVASGSADKTVRVWDAATGKELRRLEGHTDFVIWVTFNVDGKWIASGSDDNTVRVWDSVTGGELLRRGGHNGGVRCVAFPREGGSATRDGWPRLLVGCGDGTITDWILRPSEFVRGMSAGSRGCWITWDAVGEVLRYDDGAIISDPPKVSGVQGGALEASPLEPTVHVSNSGTGEFRLGLKNALKAPVYWPSIHRIGDPAGRRFDVFFPRQDPAAVVLSPGADGQPGDTATLTAILVPRCAYEDPVPFSETISLIAEGSNGGTVKFKVKAHFQTPQLVWQDPVIDQVDDSSVLRVSMRNIGRVSLPSRDVIPVFSIDAKGIALSEDNRLATSSPTLAPGAAAPISYTLPDRLAKSLRESLDRATVTLTVSQTAPRLQRWTSRPLPIRLPPIPWSLYFGLMLISVTVVGAGSYAALFLHPDVRRVSLDAAELMATPIERVPSVARLLTWTRRLRSILSSTRVHQRWMDSLSRFLESDNAGARCQMLVERLGWKAKRLEAASLDAFLAETSSDFLLSLERCLFVVPDSEMPLEDWRIELRQLVPEADRLVTLVVTTDLEHQERLLEVSRGTSNLLVTPDSRDLTAWLLSPDPNEVVSKLIASQVRITRFSPYQTGGGLRKPQCFYGRQEILSHILNRAPANYFVVGARQSGKTSLLKQIQRLSDNSGALRCRFLTLTDNDIRPALQSVFGLEEADSETLLAHMRKQRGDRPWLFLLDEADQFVRAQSSREFRTMHHMRTLAEEGIAYFILAGFWVLYESAAADYQSPIKNFGEVIEIGPLEPEAARRLVTVPMEGLGVRYESDALVDRLIEQSGRRANLISIACNELLKSLGTGGRTIDEQALNHALDGQSIRIALSGWEMMTNDDRLNRLDRILVYATVNDESFDMDGLLGRLKPFGLSYSADEIRQSLTRLELAFILHREEGRYQFRVPMFRKMIQQQAPDDLLQREIERGDE